MPLESAVSISRISQVSVPVTEVERSVTFYSRMLGLPVLHKQADMALLGCGDIRVLLSCPEDEEPFRRGSTVYFQVDDIQQAYQALEAEGVSCKGKPHKIAEFGGMAVWMAFFHDPDGTLHALTSEVPIG